MSTSAQRRSSSRNANTHPLSRGGRWHHVSDYAPDLRALASRAIAHQLTHGNHAEAEAIAATMRAASPLRIEEAA